MADHFTLGINSNMELLYNNVNPNSLGNFISSNVCPHDFPDLLSGRDFSDDHHHHHHHQRHDHSLPFMPLPDATNNNSSFNYHGDHQVDGSFYDPIAHLPTNHAVKRTSRNESLGKYSNSSIFGSRIKGENKANRHYGYGGKKRKKTNEVEVEKPRGVVHVRARRGEATDSHSLSERLRREKINGKLRCLQELVPGCYKTMGMSVMLDVTTNYIRSLQNQIEFLSMKLLAASMFYDFNSAEMEALDAMKGSNGYEITQVMGEGYGDLPQFQSTNWPL